MSDIHFHNFWQAFPENNIFKSLIEASELSDFPLEVINFYSVFGKFQRLLRMKQRILGPMKKTSGEINIWYTGENLPAPHKYDLTLSYDSNSSSNIYWPLWATYCSIKGISFESDREFLFDQAKLSKNRSAPRANKLLKACAFISNSAEPRYSKYLSLQELGFLDLYGKSVGRPIISKREIASKYMFQICFENSLREGYVTEKIFEAYSCGNIPIYHGPLRDDYLNSRSYISLEGYNVEHLQDIIEDKIKNGLDEIYTQPLLSRQFNHQILIEKLKSLA